MYQAQLAKENAVDFNDLLLKTLDLFDDDERGADRCATRFRHVLVDEFQDTNRVQYDLVRQLAEATRNLTVVGDDDQSIYAWRGAEPRNLLDFDRDFPDATVVKLEQNYRSTQTILDAANGDHRARTATATTKALWTEQRRRRADRDLSGRRRARRGVLRRAVDPPHARRRAGSRRATSRSCTAPTRSRACSRSTCARRACPRRSSARCRSSSARRSRTSSRTCACSRNPDADSAFERVVNVPARGIGDTTVDRLRAAARASGSADCSRRRGSPARGEVAGLGAAAAQEAARLRRAASTGLRDVIAQGASVAETIIQVVDRSGLRAQARGRRQRRVARPPRQPRRARHDRVGLRRRERPRPQIDRRVPRADRAVGARRPAAPSTTRSC